MIKVIGGVFWWMVTIVTLFLLDDLVFGPIFWTISVYNRPLATASAFIASWSFGLWIIDAGLRDFPNSWAAWFLRRLNLTRKNNHIAEREDSLKRKAISSFGAIIVTPLIGAVIPVLLLDKHRSVSFRSLRIHAIALTALYALEFAALHGGYGIGALSYRLF